MNEQRTDRAGKEAGFPALKLWFSEGEPCELRSTEFQAKPDDRPLKASRSQADTHQFSWTRGVHALSIFMVQLAAWSKKWDPGEFKMRGETGSPAASLDLALGKGKQNNWMTNIFGRQEQSGHSLLCAYIQRLNPDKKRKVDAYELRVRVTCFQPENVHVFVGEKELMSDQELEELATALCSGWKGTPNLPLPKPVVRLGAVEPLPGETSNVDPLQFYPFRLITDSPQFFRSPGQPVLEVLLPSREEFMNAKLYEPPVVRKAVARLQAKRWVWVAGPPSSGKTTIGLQIAFSEPLRKLPAYYLDLTEAESSSKAAILTAYSRLLSRNAVVILDNVHQDPIFMETCYSTWGRHDPKPFLILLGAQFARLPETGNVANLVAELIPAALVHRLNATDFSEVMVRFAARCGVNRKKPLLSRSQVAYAWQTFGGDILVFLRKLSSLSSDFWYKSKSDAEIMAAYVKENYLSRIPKEERRDLLFLAAYSFLGRPLSLGLFHDHLFKEARKQGLVQHSRIIRRYDEIFVEVFHPQVAERIIEGRPSELAIEDLYFDIIDKDTEEVYGLMQALEKWDKEAHLGEEPVSFQAVMKSPRAKAWIKREKLPYISKIIERYPPIDMGLEMKFRRALDGKLSGCPGKYGVIHRNKELAKNVGALEAVSIKCAIGPMAKPLHTWKQRQSDYQLGSSSPVQAAAWVIPDPDRPDRFLSITEGMSEDLPLACCPASVDNGSKRQGAAEPAKATGRKAFRLNKGIFLKVREVTQHRTFQVAQSVLIFTHSISDPDLLKYVLISKQILDYRFKARAPEDPVYSTIEMTGRIGHGDRMPEPMGSPETIKTEREIENDLLTHAKLEETLAKRYGNR